MAPLRCAATGSTGRIAKDGPWSQKKQFFMIIFVVWVFLRCFFFLFLNVLSVLLLVLQLLCFLLILCCVFVCVPVPEHFRPGCFDACRLLFLSGLRESVRLRSVWSCVLRCLLLLLLLGLCGASLPINCVCWCVDRSLDRWSRAFWSFAVWV